MRWLNDPVFRGLVEDVVSDEGDATEDPSLALLVPKAYSLLERALTHGDVAAAKARVALDVLKAAASLSASQEGGVGSLEQALAQIDATGNQYEPD